MDSQVRFRLRGQDRVQDITVRQVPQALTERIARAVESLEVVLLGMVMDSLASLALVNLANFHSLQTLSVTISFIPGNEAQTYVLSWAAIERLVLSVHGGAPFHALVLEGAFSHTLLNYGWARSSIVEALRIPLHSFSTRLVVRGGTVVTIKPPAPAVAHTEFEQKRIESLLQALVVRNALRY